MFGLTRLFEKLRSGDRRQRDRKETPQLAAYFWNNNAPVKLAVKDVSPSGFYLLTEERWYPGTLVMMTLQTDDPAAGGVQQSIAVETKTVRWGEDGVGLVFMIPNKNADPAADPTLARTANEKDFKKFLQRLLESKD